MATSKDTGPTSHPATFEPTRTASRGRLAVALIAGPLLWVASLIVVAWILRYREAVEIALAVVAVSLLVAIAVFLPMRARRVREEESA